MLDRITVHGARQHNLKNIDVEIPRNSLTVITGLSGSGKSSLAFDTIYAEGQRRYVETLSTYARQFLDQMERPDVDSIDGLSPAISIEQKTTSRSPRSTVGTITEIYDYLRLLYSSIGVPHCPVCGNEISRQTTEQILQHVLALKPEDRIMVLAPIVRGRKGEYKKDLEKLARQGFVRARIDGVLRSLDEEIPLDRRKNHTIEVVVDRLLVKPGIEKRLEASIETATKLADGLVLIAVVNGEERLYSQKLACTECGASIPQLEPRSFSFNSPYGACEDCHGLGSKWTLRSRQSDRRSVQAAARWRSGPGRGLLAHAAAARGAGRSRPHQPVQSRSKNLPKKAREALIEGGIGLPGILAILEETYAVVVRGISRVAHRLHVAGGVPRLPRQAAAPGQPGGARERTSPSPSLPACRLSRALMTVRNWELTEREQQIAGRVVDEIRRRLEFLSAVGLDYLSLDRSAATLSGGEAQRIRLATQIGSKLRGVLYVLDEPSDRPASARQRSPARNPRPPARHGQHGARGGARCRDHRARRLRDRSRARRRPAGRRIGGRGQPRPRSRKRPTRSPANISRARRDSRPAERPQAATAKSCRSAAPASTISRASTSRSRSGCSPWSPEFPAAANPR